MTAATPQQRIRRRGFMLAVVLVSFIAGYNMTLSANSYCAAQNIPYPSDATVTGGVCASSQCTPVPTNVVLCVGVGQVRLITQAMWQPFSRQLDRVARALERRMDTRTDDVVEGVHFRLHQLEMAMNSWLQDLWFQNLRPGWQAMVRQLTVSAEAQTQQIGAMMDAQEILRRTREGSGGPGSEGGLLTGFAKDRARMSVDGNACAAGTVSGLLGRAEEVKRSLAKGYMNKTSSATAGRRGTPGARGAVNYLRDKKETEDLFCDARDNGGKAGCTDENDFRGASTRVPYEKLTIPVTDPQDGDKHAAAVEMMIENLIGTPAADPVPQDLVKDGRDRDIVLKRRAFTARYNAISSVPRLIVGWRVATGDESASRWVRELRAGVTAAGGQPLLSDDELNDDVSYREAIHAMVVDRTTSGSYATAMSTNDMTLEMEKLMQDTFYLIMLNDYYDLLERTALTLAVQVSMLADQVITNAGEVKR